MTDHAKLDIQQEIANHLEWMEGIAALLGSEAIDTQELDTITRHDRCALGHWLDSDASQQFGDLPEFAQLQEAHSAFHRLAGEMITALGSGDEQRALASEERFIEMSQAVIGGLQALQRQVASGG